MGASSLSQGLCPGPQYLGPSGLLPGKTLVPSAGGADIARFAMSLTTSHEGVHGSAGRGVRGWPTVPQSGTVKGALTRQSAD